MFKTTKILFLIDGLRLGGKERRILELLKGLKNKKDIEIYVISLIDQIDYKEFYNLNINIKYLIKNDLGLYNTIFQLYKACKMIKPDIVHSWSGLTTSIIIPSKFFLNFTLINSQITNVPPSFNLFSLYYVQTKINFLFSNIITSNTIEGIKKLNSPKNKSICIYNGFDYNRLTSMESSNIIKNKLNIKTDNVVGMIGSMDGKKDFESFIDTANNILLKFRNITFLVIGNGALISKYKSLVNLNNKNKIIFTGAISNVENIIKIMDIGVLMTTSETHGEGISNVILEFMAMGKPVIASKGGGTAEIIDNNKSGFLINPGDIEDLKSHINILLKDKKLSIRMGLHGKGIIETKFNYTRMIENFISVYKSELKISN